MLSTRLKLVHVIEVAPNVKIKWSFFFVVETINLNEASEERFTRFELKQVPGSRAGWAARLCCHNISLKVVCDGLGCMPCFIAIREGNERARTNDPVVR